MRDFLKTMKLLSIVGGTFLLTATGCKLNDNDVEPLPPVSYVNLYQASPDSPDLNIILDDKVIASAFEYGDQTGYLRFLTGDRTLAFGPSGASNVVLDTTMKFEDSKAYSVFVVDEYADADLVILDDDTERPASGKAKVRFLNLSPDSPELNLNEKDSTAAMFEGQAFKEGSDFKEVTAGKYNFTVKNSTGDDLLSLPNANFLDGWSYTILVRGYKTPPSGNTNVLSAVLIVD